MGQRFDLISLNTGRKLHSRQKKWWFIEYSAKNLLGLTMASSAASSRFRFLSCDDAVGCLLFRCDSKNLSLMKCFPQSVQFTAECRFPPSSSFIIILLEIFKNTRKNLLLVGTEWFPSSFCIRFWVAWLAVQGSSASWPFCPFPKKTHYVVRMYFKYRVVPGAWGYCHLWDFAELLSTSLVSAASIGLSIELFGKLSSALEKVLAAFCWLQRIPP